MIKKGLNSNENLNKGYDVPVVNKRLDFINVMAYDFHGPWGSEVIRADHHSPLRQRLRETNSELNVDCAINYWIRQGMSPAKINMGIPLYGRSWILSSNVTTPPAPAHGPLPKGKVAHEDGTMAYYEICDAIHNKGWTVYKTSQAMGPYAVSPAANGRMWVGYDDPAMAIAKTNYVLSKGLGGVMLWDISMDDFQGISGAGPNPVTNAIVQTISQYNSSATMFPFV
jgi:chitinase